MYKVKMFFYYLFTIISIACVFVACFIASTEIVLKDVIIKDMNFIEIVISLFMTVLYLGIYMFITFFLLIAIHEIGHAVFGGLFGFQFNGITLFYISLTKYKDGIKLNINKYGHPNLASMRLPDKEIYKKFNYETLHLRFIMLYVGGVLFSIIITGLLFIIFKVNEYTITFGLFSLAVNIHSVNKINKSNLIGDGGWLYYLTRKKTKLTTTLLVYCGYKYGLNTRHISKSTTLEDEKRFNKEGIKTMDSTYIDKIVDTITEPRLLYLALKFAIDYYINKNEKDKVKELFDKFIKLQNCIDISPNILKKDYENIENELMKEGILQ